jgi:hypothetical protein
MRHVWRIAALGAAAVLGLPLFVHASGIKSVLHLGGKQQEQARLCIKQRAWMAYFKDAKGNLFPVRDTLNTSNDKDWIGLKFTDFEGPRLRVGVLKILNRSAGSEEGEHGKIEVPVAGIQETLTMALFNTNRFDVIEQKRADEITKQQTRKDVVELSPKVIMNAGKVLAVQYLVYGTVDEWRPERSAQTVGKEGAKRFFSADVANGQILFTTSERARLGEWDLSFGLSTGEKAGRVQKMPLHYLILACANKAAYKVAMFLRNQKWKGSVVEIRKKGKADNIYINAGSQQGMMPQTKLAVFSTGEKVRDHETGTILGEDLEGIGNLEVIFVQNGFSVAQVTELLKGKRVKPGDRVELATPPASLKEIPQCDALDPGKVP